jgi:hypothetical protein
MDTKKDSVVLINSRHYSPIACHTQVTHVSGTEVSTAEHAAKQTL